VLCPLQILGVFAAAQKIQPNRFDIELK